MGTWTQLAPLALALVTLAGGCAPAAPHRLPDTAGSEPSGRPAGPKRVTAGIPSNPPMLYNKLNVGGVGGQGSALQDLVHVGLTAYDSRGTLHPRLAEAVPSLENGLWKVAPDGRMETTWKLRANARWHDGTAVTPDDLAFTLQVVRDPALPYFGNVVYGSVDDIVAPEPLSVTVRWHKPFIDADAFFNAELAAPMPRHLLERAYVDSKPTFAELPFWGAEFVGTGPFKVRELVRGSHLLVEAFDGYALGRPRVDLVEVKFVLDETTLVANILAGVVELTLARSVSAEQGVQLRDEWKDGRMELTQDDWYVLYPQHLNPSPAVVADVRFKRALLYGTNRQQMAEALEGGLSSVAESFVHPNEPDYRDVERSLMRYPYDTRRASQLIEDLGFYARGADGVARNAANQRLEVEINTTRLDAHQKMLLTLANEWPRMGVAVDPVVIPPQRAQDAEYRATFTGFALQGHPRHAIRFHSTEARLPEKGYRGNNNARYMSPELDALIDRYYSTVPKPERLRALEGIVHHLSDQVVVISLIWRVDPTMIGNRLVNVGGRARTATQAWNAHEWDIKL